ncbi:MAG: TonB-dependent receptor [Bacteroidales bacterium]|nr:TonB-dependent receptor [Bacteroidales bacterium]
MRFKKILPLILIAFLSFYAQAQNQRPSRVSIKGSLQDTLHEAIPFATVMLLNNADSSLVNFLSSNDKGEFEFNNIKNSTYLLKVQHMSFLPVQKLLQPSATIINNLSVVTMKPISTMLMEVVIRAAKAPLRIKGDTVEYDASTFKVPPGSTVEDLLRRLPGIDVDADGNISTQGKDVTRMYVDGKTFFGDDPKSVTKNLGAEAISKVQVYNEKSEQSKLTGVDDGSQEKTMNLELKEEFKKGAFGKATIAGGTEERWAARANYNRFNDKSQLSFIGYGNNVNQTGVNWEDYGEFKGNNAFNNFDNGDFGFNRNGGHMFYFSSDDSPVSNYDGKGLTENYGAGTNFNFDNKKTKFNASYFYNQTQLDFEQKSYQKTYLDGENAFEQYDSLINDDFRSSHSIATRFEQEFDSSNKLIVKANFRYSLNTNNRINNQQFSDYTLEPYNTLNLDNTTDLAASKITSAAIYRHLFKKKGRSFAFSGGYNSNFSDGTENYNSINKFFDATTPTEQIRQMINTNKNVNELKSSALYTEPLSKRIFLEFFYNFSQLTNKSNRQAYPFGNEVHIDSLSAYYDQVTMYNRLGSVLRYSYNGLNASVGVAMQQLKLTGLYSLDEGLPWYNEKVTKDYPNFTPNLNLNYEFKNNMRLDLGYSNDISAPDFNDLQPVKNTSNPAYQVVGNPDLIPENAHNVEFGVHYWNPSSFSSIGVNVNYGITKNPIVYSQSTRFDPATGMITTSTPENMDQGTNMGSWLWSSIPIIKTKLTIDINGGVNASNTPTRINDTLDDIQSIRYNLGSNLNFTASSKLVLSVGGSGGFSTVRYNENKENDQDYFNYIIRSSIKWQFMSRMFFESNFNYSVFKNESFGFDQSIPLWNASVRRIMGKKNKFEMRLAAFDIFNKNVNINQYAYKNIVGTSKTNTLARYFMLSITYNMKGFENKIQKNRFM